MAKKPFSQQAVAFLNAYWKEVGSQADYIFEVAWEKIKEADMHSKGVSLIHLYEEGNDLDFNIGLYFYEKLCKFTADTKDGNGPKENQRWVTPEFDISQPTMMTSIVRKKEIREKVDVNFDGRISMLEYLLYQYKDLANPSDFVQRSMASPDEHPEVKAARLALEEVTARIKAYEMEKARLEGIAAGTGVKALGAKNQLAQLGSSPLMEELNKALILAEAAVRKASKRFGGTNSSAEANEAAKPTEGAIYWMNKDLDVKKKRYGKANTSAIAQKA